MLLIGPVIGLVTDTSVRILFECNNKSNTIVSIYPTHSAQLTFATQGPTVATFKGLRPSTTYKVVISHENGSSEGTFSTSPSQIYILSCNNMYKGDNRAWIYLNERKPDMCIHIGDQVYMDYGGDTFDKALRCKSYEDMIECFRNAYRTCWSQAHMKDLLSSCSHVMMWDDHDVHNSWDQFLTLPHDWTTIVQAQGWETLASLFISRRSKAIIAGMQAYVEYQLSLSGIEYPRSFSLTIAGKRILFLDMRIAKASHKSVLDGIDCTNVHDIVITGVPIFFLPSIFLNRISAKVCTVGGLTDVYDQSNLNGSYMRDIATLMGKDGDTCVLISGDSHMCGRSEIEIGDKKIVQWVSSGISTPLPPKILWLLLLLCRKHLRLIGRKIAKITHTYWHRGNGYLFLNLGTDQWRDSIHHIIPSLML